MRRTHDESNVVKGMTVVRFDTLRRVMVSFPGLYLYLFINDSFFLQTVHYGASGIGGVIVVPIVPVKRARLAENY